MKWLPHRETLALPEPASRIPERLEHTDRELTEAIRAVLAANQLTERIRRSLWARINLTWMTA